MGYPALSVRGAGGKSAMDMASVYIPPGSAIGRSHEDIRDEVLGAMASTAGLRRPPGRGDG